jgi:hypothetical protein
MTLREQEAFLKTQYHVMEFLGSLLKEETQLTLRVFRRLPTYIIGQKYSGSVGDIIESEVGPNYDTSYCSHVILDQRFVIGLDGIVRETNTRNASEMARILAARRTSQREPSESPFEDLMKFLSSSVITASHNPYHNNDYKAYFADGAQVIDPQATRIIEKFTSVKLPEIMAIFKSIEAKSFTNLIQTPDEECYIGVVKDSVLDRSSMASCGKKVVFAPLHGTGDVICICVKISWN